MAKISLKDYESYKKLVSRVKVILIKIVICLVIPYVIAITFGHMNNEEIFSLVGQFFNGNLGSSAAGNVFGWGLILYSISTIIVWVKEKAEGEFIQNLIVTTISIIVLLFWIFPWFIGDICFSGNYGINSTTVRSFFTYVALLGPLVFDILSLIFFTIYLCYEYKILYKKPNLRTEKEEQQKIKDWKKLQEILKAKQEELKDDDNVKAFEDDEKQNWNDNTINKSSSHIPSTNKSYFSNNDYTVKEDDWKDKKQSIM